MIVKVLEKGKLFELCTATSTSAQSCKTGCIRYKFKRERSMAASGGRAALARAWHQGIRSKLSCFTKQSAAAMQTLRDTSGINPHSDQKSHLFGNPRIERDDGACRLWSRRQMCTTGVGSLPPKEDVSLKGMLNVGQLKELARLGKIDTVVVGLTDCYGRLVGKRYTADFFLESAVDDGTHACSYLLATDMNMEPVPGYKFASWEAGYGDIHLVPDMNTLRVASWLEKTAIVLCDVVKDDHSLAPHAPRSILRNQIKAAQAIGAFVPMAASELEYFLYQDTYEEAKDKGYYNLKPAGWVREDYHIFQGTRGEYFHGPARRHLEASGVPVENSKGEFGLGQHELNVKYAEILEMGDRHIVYKQCLRELADSMGVSVTFMAKPDAAQPGSSCHIHLSLWENGRNIFAGDHTLGSTKCSDEFRWFLGGWMKHTPELMCFYAPNVNSYKRFMAGSWAPTQIAWSRDNRTAPFRILGSGKSLRIECRLPGADCNVYLAFAAALASGLDGIRNKIEPPPPLEGNIYFAKDLLSVPQSLGEAAALFKKSEFAKEMLGEDVHHHYLHFFESEQLAYLQVVTDWEKTRYFEQI